MDLLYEFAITPDVFDGSVTADEASETQLKQILKGVQENGIIADLHRSRWSQHVQDKRAPSLRPEVRDRVLTLLQSLHDRHRIVRHPRRLEGDPASDEQWLELAIASHRRIPFTQIIAGGELCRRCAGAGLPLTPIPKVLDSSAWEGRKRSKTIAKSEPEFRAALSPLLRHARAIRLIDPYLVPRTTRFFETIKLVVELAGKRGYGQPIDCRIDIHAGDPTRYDDNGTLESPEERLAAWQTAIRAVDISPHRIRVFLWKNYDGGERLHDRFIITDQIGISVPGGLDCRTASANSTTWSVMEFEDQQFWATRFDPAGNVYELMKPSPLEIP